MEVKLNDFITQETLKKLSLDENIDINELINNIEELYNEEEINFENYNLSLKQIKEKNIGFENKENQYRGYDGQDDYPNKIHLNVISINEKVILYKIDEDGEHMNEAYYYASYEEALDKLDTYSVEYEEIDEIIDNICSKTQLNTIDFEVKRVYGNGDYAVFQITYNDILLYNNLDVNEAEKYINEINEMVNLVENGLELENGFIITEITLDDSISSYYYTIVVEKGDFKCEKDIYCHELTRYECNLNVIEDVKDNIDIEEIEEEYNEEMSENE